MQKPQVFLYLLETDGFPPPRWCQTPPRVVTGWPRGVTGGGWIAPGEGVGTVPRVPYGNAAARAKRQGLYKGPLVGGRLA
jgi:hypothetical protein